MRQQQHKKNTRSITATKAFLIASMGAGLAAATWMLRKRAIDLWLPSYLLHSVKRRPWPPTQHVHLLLCIADHYEPTNGNVPPDVALRRVDHWVHEYPRLFGSFRDSDGCTPQHTFFYPLELYSPNQVHALAQLCRAGFGEVEIHLHHDRDTATALRQHLLAYKKLLASRHGLLSQNRRTGETVYAFIHGDWALDNSLPDGSACGVTNELHVLSQTGCYADFTLPAVPSRAQTRKINSIYYATGNPRRPRAHDRGIDVGAGPARDALMLIQGPLVLDWRRRCWGLMPHIENGCIQYTQPAHIDRLPLWLKARVQIPQRPDWFFVKLHTHGAPEDNQRVLLAEPMVQFHRDLQRLTSHDTNFHFHYVTARQMYNLARAAEAGWQGSVEDARDFEVIKNPRFAIPQEDTIMPQQHSGRVTA